MTTGAGTPKGKRPTRPGLPVWWRCLLCGDHGTGDGDAERHTRTTTHPTVTTARPPSDTPDG